MYTTNTATKANPMTYMDRKRESERFSKIKDEMDKMAFENPERFLNEPRFRELNDAYWITVQNLASLI